MKRILLPVIIAMIVVPFFDAPLAQADEPDRLTLENIFLEPVIPGIRPSLHSFAGDQQSVYISWNDSAYFDTGLYKLDLDGGTPEPAEDVNRVFHSQNNRLIAYTKDGDLYISNADGSAERNLFSSEDNVYSIQWSPNGRSIAFGKSGDIWVTQVSRPGLQQVTRKSSDEPNFSLNGWAGNQALIISQSDHSDSRTIYFPTYLGDFVSPGGTTRGIPAVTVQRADLETGERKTLVDGVHRSSTSASASGRFIAVDHADAALKERKLKIFDTHGDTTASVLFEDSTDGWLHGHSMEFAPSDEKLMFLSEQSGWNHMYIADLRTGSVEQHTDGDFEITWASWIGNNTIVYANNEADYGERHLFVYNTQNGTAEQLTEREAYRYQFSLSPDKSTLIYAKTYFNEPYDLFKIDLSNPSGEIQLTNSVPEQFQVIDWQEEEYIRFTGRDGETGLSMSVLYPEGYNPENTYPVVVFAHGAGSLQNVYKGWSNNYWREYMFHQYLTYHDYIVVEVDFRHSTGYGRKFREDVTNWMGKYETIDIVDGLDWLQEETGGALDLDNVGIYGGSYGGFMALYVLTDKPDRFHAGAALRKVSNWRNYYYANPWYTLPRLGDPDEVPEHYDRSSPLTHASELEHPVILLHGLIDDNVGSQDAFQYAEELIQSGHEQFEMMIYPSERHGFTSPNSWYDEYRRIFEFFEEHLKSESE
ncbi:S9 family peptidase [Rhodohalobacter sp. SW132]|uniref:S9 family peptidase n=1 Tax=Rhodohalobacter sp. SW132 TaxID=2293433 RepID=UPI000E247605|nr:prolyl oligopeptidase family serine peptidase [Rhodohalobacter sp. SW132]REL38480.1 S9 family peptidase [Rhodohalobacter sp. SW132]